MSERPALEVADIIRLHGAAFRETHGGQLSASQQRALHDLAAFRTAALGGHVEPEVVSPATPSLTTSASETAGGVVGTAVPSDTATPSGGFTVAAGSPAPTLTFTLIAPDGSAAGRPWPAACRPACRAPR